MFLAHRPSIITHVSMALFSLFADIAMVRSLIKEATKRD